MKMCNTMESHSAMVVRVSLHSFEDTLSQIQPKHGRILPPVLLTALYIVDKLQRPPRTAVFCNLLAPPPNSCPDDSFPCPWRIIVATICFFYDERPPKAEENDFKVLVADLVRVANRYLLRIRHRFEKKHTPHHELSSKLPVVTWPLVEAATKYATQVV